MMRQIAVELFLMVLAGIILALIGPFGSFALPLGERLLLWPLMILSGYPVFRGLGAISRWLSQLAHIPYPLAALLALAVASLPVTLIVLLLWFHVPIGEAARAPMAGPLYFQVLLVGLMVHAVMHLLFRHRVVPPADVVMPGVSAPPVEAIVRDVADTETRADDSRPALPLPPDFGPVQALKGEDHYVRVIGEGREDMILMRMRDAIERLGPVEGLRVHRSWWVAKNAVESIRREGRAAVVILKDGQEAPVARDMMPQLRAAGWL